MTQASGASSPCSGFIGVGIALATGSLHWPKGLFHSAQATPEARDAGARADAGPTAAQRMQALKARVDQLSARVGQLEQRQLGIGYWEPAWKTSAVLADRIQPSDLRVQPNPENPQTSWVATDFVVRGQCPHHLRVRVEAGSQEVSDQRVDPSAGGECGHQSLSPPSGGPSQRSASATSAETRRPTPMPNRIPPRSRHRVRHPRRHRHRSRPGRDTARPSTTTHARPQLSMLRRNAIADIRVRGAASGLLLASWRGMRRL